MIAFCLCGTLNELSEFDPTFIDNVYSTVLDNIVSVFSCARTGITDLYPLKKGITNLSCHFTIGNDEFVYRFPGIGTEKMIDRKAEAEALLLASEIGLDNTYLHVDAEGGWKISRFVPDARTLDIEKPDEFRQAMQLSRLLHESGRELERRFDFIDEGIDFEEILKEHGSIDLPGYVDLREKVLRLKEF